MTKWKTVSEASSDTLTITHTANVAGNPVAAEQVAQQILDVQNTSYTDGLREIKLAGGQTLSYI